MNNIDKLVELISKRDYPDKESLIQRLKAISSQFDDKFKYTTDFIVELNDLLAQEEKFSDDEIQFLIKFSSISINFLLAVRLTIFAVILTALSFL